MMRDVLLLVPRSLLALRSLWRGSRLLLVRVDRNDDMTVCNVES